MQATPLPTPHGRNAGCGTERSRATGGGLAAARSLPTTARVLALAGTACVTLRNVVVVFVVTGTGNAICGRREVPNSDAAGDAARACFLGGSASAARLRMLLR